MPTIDEELGQMERDIRQLKIEYDQYFGGGRKRPPAEIEWRIELLIKRYGERGGDMKLNQRFRFNNLSQTYAKYKEIFRKKLKQKEEGTVQHHFGAAARAIEAQRAAAKQKESAAAGSSGGAFRITCSRPEQETQQIDELYQVFLKAKEKAGEQIGKLTAESFNEFVRKKTKDLQTQKNCNEVEFVVEVIGSQVKLKAVVKS